MKILFVAADAMEFSGLIRACDRVTRVNAGIDWTRAGRLRGHEVLLAANGAGRERAAAAVAAGCKFTQPDIVVNTGFCGALDPALGIASLLAGTAILSDTGRFSLPEFPGAGGCPKGLVYTLDRVAQTAAEKCRLRESGAAVVEMEAAGVAAETRARGLPLYCVRAVTDLAGETFANDFNRALRSDGHFDTISILRGTLRHPVMRLPELVRLKNRCARAARTLGEFFADCRF